MDKVIRNYKYGNIQKVSEDFYNCTQKGVEYSVVKTVVGIEKGRYIEDNSSDHWSKPSFRVVERLKPIKKLSKENIKTLDELIDSQHRNEMSFYSISKSNLAITKQGNVCIINSEILPLNSRDISLEMKIRRDFGTLQKTVEADYNLWRQELSLPLKNIEEDYSYYEAYVLRFEFSLEDKLFADTLQTKLKEQHGKDYHVKNIYSVLVLPNGYYIDRFGVYYNSRSYSIIKRGYKEYKTTVINDNVDDAINMLNTLTINDNPVIYTEIKNLEDCNEYSKYAKDRINYFYSDDITREHVSLVNHNLLARILDLKTLLKSNFVGTLKSQWSYLFTEYDSEDVVRQTLIAYTSSDDFKPVQKAESIMKLCWNTNEEHFAYMLSFCVALHSGKISSDGESYISLYEEHIWFYKFLLSHPLKLDTLFDNINRLNRLNYLQYMYYFSEIATPNKSNEEKVFFDIYTSNLLKNHAYLSIVVSKYIYDKVVTINPNITLLNFMYRQGLQFEASIIRSKPVDIPSLLNYTENAYNRVQEELSYLVKTSTNSICVKQRYLVNILDDFTYLNKQQKEETISKLKDYPSLVQFLETQ